MTANGLGIVNTYLSVAIHILYVVKFVFVHHICTFFKLEWYWRIKIFTWEKSPTSMLYVLYYWLFTICLLIILWRILTKHYISITMKESFGLWAPNFENMPKTSCTCNIFTCTVEHYLQLLQQRGLIQYVDVQVIWKLIFKARLTLLFACYPQHEDVIADHYFCYGLFRMNIIGNVC